MRLVGSDSKLSQVELGEGGKVVNRSKDGTFHVDTTTGKDLVKTGDFAVAGTNFRNAQGWLCLSCRSVRLLKGTCGKCGSTDLVPEE